MQTSTISPAEPPRPAVRIPLSMTQKTSAKRMLESAREIPQFSVGIELNADKLFAIRTRLNATIEDKQRKVSLTALLIWLTARVLQKHPRLNARFDQDAVLLHDAVNVAVAIDTPAGLTVPVIHKAEMLSVYEIADTLKDLIARATLKRLSLKDFCDATFTVSNLGMFGVARFIPLVNPPQAAILGIGGPRIGMELNADNQIAHIRIIELTVTADHRITDGAEVARFLESLRVSLNDLFVSEDLLSRCQKTESIGMNP